MNRDSLYLFNPPEGADEEGVKNVQKDKLDAILNRPLSGDDVAFKVMIAQSTGKAVNLSMDEFKLYDEWHKKQEMNWWETASGAAGTFFGDIGSGIASLTPFGEKRNMKTAVRNIGNLGPTTAEALARGTRDLVGLYKEASKNQNSPFYRLFNPQGDVYDRYTDFHKLANWRAQSQRIAEGQENVIMPDTSSLIGRDITTLSAKDLYTVNNELAVAGSYFLDPMTLITLGESAFAKAGAKSAMSSAMNSLAKDALKEGISGTASSLKNTAARLEKGKILGYGLTEKLGKAFRVSGESVDTLISKPINWVKQQADELLDTNLHTTPNANLRITGPTKGQAGFGGSLMAGIGLGTIGLPYAATIVPIWAVANASRIGGAFIETLGKEMANGAGVLGRMGLEQTSTGKLARVLSKWAPMGGYIGDMTKAVVKSGAYGAAIGYATAGEEGAASGMGTGMAIGTTHYHFGVARNIVKGRSREAMVAGLINNINDLRQSGFTHKADTVLKYLSEIQAQHGDDAFFRNLGTYLGIESDDHVALSMWDKADFLRLKDDPTVPQSIRKAINDVIGADGNAWNGLFMGKNNKQVPYFIHKDSESGKTHVIINTWATDITGKTQATALKGEFYHVLADAYKEAATKPRFIEEIYEGISRTLRGSENPEGRKRLAQMFRNAADNLPNIGGKVKNQKGLPARVLSHLKLMNEQAGTEFEVMHVAGSDKVNFDGFIRPRYRWVSRNADGTRSGYDIYEGSDGKFAILNNGKTLAKDLPSLVEAMRIYRQETFKPSYEPTQQGEPPPNVAGQRERVTPEEPKAAEPTPAEAEEAAPTQAQRAESVYQAIDLYEKTGRIDGDKFHVLLEEIGESIFDAHEQDLPFDYIFLGGDLGFARNLIEETKHRISRIIDRNGRQAGFVPDFNKPFVDWFKDSDGKAIVDPYMRDLFKKFIRVHRERSMNLNGYNIDVSKLSPAMLKNFVEENGIEHEFDVDERTGNYVRKPEEQVNAENLKRYQSAAFDLLDAEKKGVATGFFFYASDKDMPDTKSLDTENENGALFQEGWRNYRTTQADIVNAQRKGVLPTKEELQQLVKRTGVWGNRNRPRTGEIDDLVATAKKGSVIFTGIPTVEGFKILQKHLPKKQMEAIAQIAPLILDGGTSMNNVVRVKYAGFTHVDESGRKLKRSKEDWSAVEKNMVFYGMELRATLRNPKSGKFDYKKPHAAFMLRGVDIDVLQRRIQWMWKNEKETRKRWSSMVEFEKDVYRLIENYSAKTALGGSRFFGGGDEGKAKKRLACAAIGAFPSKKMTGGDVDVDDVEFDLPEIDWHHYQLRSYGQGKGGRDIAWTNIRADAIRSVLGTDDKMRVPYTERAYYRAQELYQAAPTRVPREDEDIPVSVRTVSMDVSSTAGKTRIWAGKEVLPDWIYTNSTQNIQGFTPSDILLAIKGGKVEMGARAAGNLKQFVKGSIGHDEATDSVIVYYHGFVAGKPFDVVNMGQFGLHIGTKEAAMLRNYNLGVARNIPADKTYNSLMPLVVNIKKPLRMADRGLWSPQSVAESILASLLPDQREAVHQNNYEGASSRARIKQDIGDVTDADIKFLREFIDKQKQINANKPNQYAAAQMDLISTGMGSEMLTPAFKRIANEAYQQSLPLQNWLRSKGVDSIAYWNTAEGKAWSYIIFDGKNAKHISENTGEFSPDNISMFQQHASTYGAKDAEQRKYLRANWEQAILDGDIFNSIAIRDNFLGNMPAHTVVMRQSAEEAVVQGMSLGLYNTQFKTGQPVVLTAVHGTRSNRVMRGDFDVNWNPKLSHAGATWFASHMAVAKYFANNAGPKGGVVRALIKSRNPLVVDFKEQYWTKGLDKYIKKAKDGNHDALIALNILDDVSEAGKNELLTHNQYVIFPDNVDENIAVIDNSTMESPVPRGLGLVNDVPLELPFLQQADNANQGKQEAKRTFYSAVEKFVEEKITDKTSLNELMGLLDPTRGTGIVKSELEFLDIAGWVEEQKKLNPSTKAKVDKAALLEYIRTHKFELQEDKTNTAWYSLQGMDPNNPQVQSQVEGGYESYAPANKGYDELHPSTNYRVLLLRAPQGTDYSGGEGGHFADHENIMAFARVSDIYLDRETEVPSPPPDAGRGKGKDYAKEFRGENNPNDVDAVERLTRNIKYFFDGSNNALDFEGLRTKSPQEIFDIFIGGTLSTTSFANDVTIPAASKYESLGFVVDRLMHAKPELYNEIIGRLKQLYLKHAKPLKNSGLSDYFWDYNIRSFGKTTIDDQALFPHSIIRGFGENNSEKLYGTDQPQVEFAKHATFETTPEGARGMFMDTVELVQSYLTPQSESSLVDPTKKKMLFVMELQSDTAQKMQGRNDKVTRNILTQQDIERIKQIESEVSVLNDKLSNATLTPKEESNLRIQKMDLLDEKRKLSRKEDRVVLNQRELVKNPRFQLFKEEKLRVIETLKKSIDNIGRTTILSEMDLSRSIATKLNYEDAMNILVPQQNTTSANLPPLILDKAKMELFNGLLSSKISRLLNNVSISLGIDSLSHRQKDFTPITREMVRDAIIKERKGLVGLGIPNFDESIEGSIAMKDTSLEIDALVLGEDDSKIARRTDAASLFKDEKSLREAREEIYKYIEDRMAVRMGHTLYDFRDKFGTEDSGMMKAFMTDQQMQDNFAFTEFMPFLRTEDFSKLMFKKLLKEMVDGDYEGIILIPPELPKILTGGESGYFYSKILPKVMEGYTKKFGGKLRQNKSLTSKDKTLGEVQSMVYTLNKAHLSIQERTGLDAEGTMKKLDGMAREILEVPEYPNLERFRDYLMQGAEMSSEEATKALNYAIEKRQGKLSESLQAIKLSDIETGLPKTVIGDPQKSASQRGLILDRTPQMDAIKDGQPMWQAAPKRKKAGAGEPETVGDVQGVPKKPRDRSVGEYESPVPMPVIPKTTKEEASAPVNGIEQSKVAQQLIKEGVANYRGFKFVVNKENEIEIFNPAGKRVTITQQFLDKDTGQTVFRKVNTAPFPDDAITLVDKYIGGRQQTQGETQADRLGSPAKVNPATAETQVVKPAERAIPVDKAMDDLGVVESQVKAGGLADYYGIYKVGFDQKMGKYYAMDNGKQMVSLLVPSPFQSGPRTMSGQYHPDLASVLQQLDKKFDKTKYQSKSPSALASAQRTATAVPAAPVAPQAPVAAPSKPTPAPKRVEASAVPPAVTEATRQLPPKPKAQPTRKPKASIPEKTPVASTQATKAPEVVMPEPAAPQVVAPKQQVTPVEVVTDKEYMEKQAKALGKGFIEMLKDPTLSKYIIESLNVDDNLTLKGTSEDASTADGRFSVVKKGRKLEVMQNNYVSPITGITYNRKPIAYVNTIQQAQIVIRRLELERTIALKSRNMRAENGLAILASENPAFAELARIKEIKENAFIQMLLSMRDQNITPIMIDPVTLEPLLVMMPSEPAVAQVTRPKRTVQIAGMLPEYGTEGEPMPLALIDRAITFNMFEDAEIRGLDYNTKATAMRFTNALGYQILKFNGKYRLFNPMKTSVSVRDDETSIIDDLIRDIHRNGIQK